MRCISTSPNPKGVKGMHISMKLNLSPSEVSRCGILVGNWKPLLYQWQQNIKAA